MGIRGLLTYQEYASGMHTVRCVGRSQRGIPEFVTNEDQFKSVLVHAAVRYIFRSGKIPANISYDLNYLKALANDRYMREMTLVQDTVVWNAMMNHLNTVGACGGYLQFIAGVMYKAWRLKWHSVEIATEYNKTPCAINKYIPEKF